MSDVSRVEEIFLAALEKSDPAECAAFLDEKCRGEDSVRYQVERLLQAHPRAKQFLVASQTVDLPNSAERAGTIIGGRYKLLEPIGEGGMGSVWMAQQTEPVRRTVAIKLIKAGMDTRAVLTRFEAERQALALMDHPNIAKVLDAGASDEGRPFFVMELVKGVPITRYCDERKLTLRQRLDLFIPVCQAVQHAHQKGIIHRDLKPSNVLVAQYDDHPVPKVIDFGVAKAAGQPLTDRTLVTGFGAVVGTPEYMSPEQAQFNQLDIDTRSDIYALGVLLYELLTGSTPVSRQELEKAGLIEILRMIREQEPPRPSTRLSTAQGLPKIAADRGSEPRSLAGLLRNDLDWIVMKALEKNRNRRYETATGFAADIQRYLLGEPVQAHPPSTAYRVKKFARKHRVSLTTVAAFALLLIASAAVSGWLALKARRAEAVASDRRIEAEANAKEAKSNADLYFGSLKANADARIEAELRSTGLQMDLDLAEFQSDPRSGLLRLVRSLRTYPEVLEHKFKIGDGGEWEISFDSGHTLKQNQLRQFATMAILAEGQSFAPLLRPKPIVDDGLEVPVWRESSTGQRLLTLGAGRTVKLWEKSTGRRIAILRQGDEKVITAGFSPDGSTIYSHSWDGVVRFWEAEDGRFRARTEPRPDRLKLLGQVLEDRLDEYDRGTWINSLSNDRMLTSVMIEKKENDFSPAFDSQGPDELWDSRTGRLIARLEGRGAKQGTFGFLGAGRWIKADGQDHVLLMFSAIDGRPVVRLDHDKKPVTRDVMQGTSPSGRTVATVAFLDSGEFVYLWDVASLRLTSVTGPMGVTGQVELINDDLFVIKQESYDRVFRSGDAAQIGQIPAVGLIRSEAGRMLYDSGRLFDMKTWKQLQPPRGRKYHPDLARFAPDGRFTYLGPHRNRRIPSLLVDTLTEKSIPLSADWSYKPSTGWTGAGSRWTQQPLPYRLPTLNRLNIPPDLLELWAKVGVRGELDDEGVFVKWDEPTWEKKRGELTAMPVPIPDFPFPGNVAADRLHWLRQEYENAAGADKPRLAKQLLDRAEAARDHVESAHWRTLLPKPDPTGPSAPK